MHLFDLDGTLIDSNPIWQNVDLTFLGQHGLASTPEYEYMVGHSIFPVAAQYTKDYYGLSLSPEEIMAQWIALAEDCYNSVSLKPGALAYLQQCKAKGEEMALFTACVPRLAKSALAHTGLDAYFSNVVFSQDLGLEKRNPQAYVLATQQLGVLPAACTFYDDGPGNCAAARTLGIRVVGIYDPFHHNHQTELMASCDTYIRSFDELLNV